MKALIKSKARKLAKKIHDRSISAEKHIWIVPRDYPEFDTCRPGLLILNNRL